MPDLAPITTALTQAFPQLRPIVPVKLLGAGFSSIAVETAGGIVFRIARTPHAGQRYQHEARLLPVLQPHLPMAIPQPQFHLTASSAFPFGLIGYPKLPGTPLQLDAPLTRQQGQHFARQIGAIIHALQCVPLSALNLSDSFTTQHTRWTDQHQQIMPALKNLLEPAEYANIDRWWDAFLTHTRMQHYPPVVQHGDLWFENLLAQGDQITGLLDFENLTIGDPAQDFVPQLYLGETFLRWVIDGYQQAGGQLDPGFDDRLRQLWAVREFGGVAYALDHDLAEMPDALAKIRRGPLLNPAGLDGWRRDWRT